MQSSWPNTSYILRVRPARFLRPRKRCPRLDCCLARTHLLVTLESLLDCLLTDMLPLLCDF